MLKNSKHFYHSTKQLHTLKLNSASDHDKADLYCHRSFLRSEPLNLTLQKSQNQIP